ncbi:MAG: hypothetical protein IT198_11905 [Acidimicrobiia bacterium]|nr:hypothetical protein [Acidimicrobiia bacterium]
MNGKKLLLIAIAVFAAYYVIQSPQLASEGIKTVSGWVISVGETVVQALKSLLDGLLTG